MTTSAAAASRGRPRRLIAGACLLAMLASLVGCESKRIRLRIAAITGALGIAEIIELARTIDLIVPPGSVEFGGAISWRKGSRRAPRKLRFVLEIDGQKVLDAKVKARKNGSLRQKSFPIAGFVLPAGKRARLTTWDLSGELLAEGAAVDLRVDYTPGAAAAGQGGAKVDPSPDPFDNGGWR